MKTEKEYLEMIAQHDAAPRTWGRINCYRCPDGHKTYVIDRDNGVTPFILGCRHPAARKSNRLASAAIRYNFDGPNVCGLAAESAFYCVPSEYEALATFEFFRPSYQYLRDRFTDPRVIEHIEDGGLCLRRIGELDAIGADPGPLRRNRRI